MFDHILVPLDGSTLAAASIPFAVTLGRAVDARISVLAVVEPFPASARLPDAAVREADERQTATSTAYLESEAAKIRVLGLAVTTVIRHGNPAEEIIAYAEEGGCDLIAMGTHGRTGMDRVRMGSVAQHVLRHTTVPTMVVRPPAAGRTEDVAPIAGVIATLDGSAWAEAALPIASSIAKALAVPLTLLRVIPTWSYLVGSAWDAGYYYPETEEMMRDEEEAVAAYLEAIAAGLRAPGLTVRTHWLRSLAGPVEQDLVAHLATQPAAIAVMASHGRGGVLRWALGSTAEAVLDQAPCPILVMRAGMLASKAPVDASVTVAP